MTYYFDFYEDKLKQIFNSDETSLLQLNLKAIEIIQSILKTNIDFKMSDDYTAEFVGEDFRNQFNAKKQENKGWENYYQTFMEKHGFLEDLSIIDLICNNGPESLLYIKKLQ